MPSPLLTRLLDLFYPPRCVLCDRLLPDGGARICPQCEKRSDPSMTVRRDAVRFRLCVCALPYRDPYRQAILRFKFGGCGFYADEYGKLIAQTVRQRLAGEEIDLITYVPLSRSRRRKRGYDQAKLLAEAAAKELGLPCVGTLKKVRNVPPQSAQPDETARRKNISGAYRITSPTLPDGKRILLIDDILTTGSTMSEAAGVLRGHGAKTVFGAALACADHGSKSGE